MQYEAREALVWIALGTPYTTDCRTRGLKGGMRNDITSYNRPQLLHEMFYWFKKSHFNDEENISTSKGIDATCCSCVCPTR